MDRALHGDSVFSKVEQIFKDMSEGIILYAQVKNLKKELNTDHLGDSWQNDVWIRLARENKH